MHNDIEFLKAALAGYEFRRAEIDRKIAEIKQKLGRPAVVSKKTERPKRVLSEAARRRISQAQKKRWALARQQRKVA